MTALRIAASLAAAAAVGATAMSAVHTFVVPRARPVMLTRLVFLFTRRIFTAVAARRSAEDRHRLLSLFPPLTLLVLPVVWLVVVFAGFAVLFWAIDRAQWREAVDLSGSSLLTIGFARPDHLPATLLSFAEAALGLALLALLITYLPTIYGAFTRREVNVALLEVRAGRPPTAVEMLRRFQAIGMLEDTDDLWADWELWFVELEETHTSLGSLALFRSDRHDVSWVIAAGAVLDAAALLISTVDVPHPPRASLCIRSGFLSLRRIADYFSIPYDPDPRPDDPISIAREEFDDACARLADAGAPLVADRDQAWRDFAGWRVNYDAPLLGLAALTASPPAPWSSDRAPTFQRPPITRRGGRGRPAHQGPGSAT